MNRLARTFVVALLTLPVTSSAQEASLNRTRQQAIVEKTLEHLAANYIYPDRVKAVEQVFREGVRRGKYQALATMEMFLEALNRDMQAAANDKHLRVIHNPRIAAQLVKEAAGATDVSSEYIAMLRGENFRLRRAESLDGNVGYFKFDNFVEQRLVKDALVGAMNMLHASDALIVDLSDNGGGASDSVDLLLGYFLPEGMRVAEGWNRATNRTTVSIVTRSPEVRALLDTPLYVLVSERTASAAEAVAYALQQAKRAVVVGTRTKGMANPGQHFLIDDALFVMIPTILNRSVLTGTNWEGVGVIPDIEAPSGKALDAAMAHALRRLADREPGSRQKERLRFAADGYASLISPGPVPPELPGACVGDYEGGQSIIQREELFFVTGGRSHRMTYLGDRTFAVEGRKDYRLRCQIDEGRAARVDVLWFDDTADQHRRAK